MRDLDAVREVDCAIEKRLPITYTSTMMAGYVNMPSARMAEEGMLGLGASWTPPYWIFSLNFQALKQIELSGNYRVFYGRNEENFGHLGFGADADRTANAKFSFLAPNDGDYLVPNVALGFEDFFGSQRFYSAYIVATQSIPEYNLELTLGWGKGRIKGVYGGLQWSPLNYKDINVSFLAEYDATDYENHKDEHEKGREVKSRVNLGISANLLGFLGVKVGSIRGTDLSAMANIHYNFGQTKGLIPKKDDPKLYQSPLDIEPIGMLRSEKEFAVQLAFALKDQGLHLASAFLSFDDDEKRVLYVRIINLRYWRNKVVRKRIEHVIAYLLPDNVDRVGVIIEEAGIDVEAYKFRKEELVRYREGELSQYELRLLSTSEDPPAKPTPYDATEIFRARRRAWTFNLKPRLISFFGSVKGKYKYSLGVAGGPSGYLFNSVFYNIQASYSIASSLSDVGDMDLYNPSQILNVQSDLVRYYKHTQFNLDQAYVQKGWNMGSGWFTRLGLGYFAINYAGVAAEALYYPVQSNWAFGLEGAGLLKRDYTGLGFQWKVRKLNGFQSEWVPFIGYQYFATLYYDFKPLALDVEVKAGQFLGRDFGARLMATKYYPSGLRFSIWYTPTTAKDVVNGSRYYDKGIAFRIPFDVFLPTSSREQLGYGISAWLRDTGVVAPTGQPLFPTIQAARVY